MRVLCCDPSNKYFFLAVNKKELEEQIMPLYEDLLEEYSHDAWKHLYVTAPWLKDKELQAQARIKENPFTSKTFEFTKFIHEPCDADAYIVVSPDLMQLYFVPFNLFSPYLWKDDGHWNEVDKRNINLIAEIATVPFTYRGGKPIPVNQESWSDADVEELVADDYERLPKWKQKGPEFVFNMIISQLRKNRIWPKEAQKLMIDGGCHLPPSFWEQDHLHLMIQSDYFVEKEPDPVVKSRTIEEEETMLDKLLAESNGWVAGERLAFDYIDGYITWDILLELFDNHPGFESAKNLPDSERRKWLWLNWYNPNGPFVKKQ